MYLICSQVFCTRCSVAKMALHKMFIVLGWLNELFGQSSIKQLGSKCEDTLVWEEILAPPNSYAS